MDNVMSRESMLTEAFRLQRSRRLNRGAVSRLLRGHAAWASLEAAQEDSSEVEWVDALDYYASRLPDWGSMRFSPDLADIDIDVYFKAPQEEKRKSNDENRVVTEQKRAQDSFLHEILPTSPLGRQEPADGKYLKAVEGGNDEEDEESRVVKKQKRAEGNRPTNPLVRQETVPENFSAVLSGLKHTLTLRKKDYMPFVRIMEELQTDTSMEVGLRCILELDLLGTEKGNTVTIHPSPYIFNVNADFKCDVGEKSRGSQRLVLLLQRDVPIKPTTEWFVGALALHGPSIEAVSHYVTIAIRNMAKVFTKVTEMQKSSGGLCKKTDLADLIGIEGPQLLIFDSMTRPRGHARFEPVFRFLHTMLYITWATSKSETAKTKTRIGGLKYEYSRDKRVPELTDVEMGAFDSTWESVSYLYKSSTVLVNGPQQPSGVECGYYVLTHVANSLQDGYLNGVAQKAARVFESQKKKKKTALRLVSSRQRHLFSEDDVSKTFKKISDWVLENVKGTTTPTCALQDIAGSRSESSKGSKGSKGRERSKSSDSSESSDGSSTLYVPKH